MGWFEKAVHLDFKIGLPITTHNALLLTLRRCVRKKRCPEFTASIAVHQGSKRKSHATAQRKRSSDDDVEMRIALSV